MEHRPRLQPLLLLRDMEARGRLRARDLPHKLDVKRAWTGIGFRLGEMDLVAPLSEVHEMMPYPVLTVVPGAKPWVKGIANVRGNLLPVVSLAGYLADQGGAQIARRTRVLVVRDGDIYVGLVVDSVYGLQHFCEEERCAEESRVEASIQPYLQGAFLQAGRYWRVFSLHRLTHSPQFLQVAV
ncbi:MAG: chemotaxis protein CheW [Gammaproteobacteria bacterium]|nr:chemotaxis protein CheW [Gammaproteobacteria bacterium]